MSRAHVSHTALAPLGIAIGFLTLAGAAQAAFLGGPQVGNCGAACDQSVNFHSAGVGNPIVGDTNPGPVYNVTASTTDAGITLHGSGQVVDTRLLSDTSQPGPGFGNLLLTPQAPYAWTYVEFQLNSAIHFDANTVKGLQFTAFDQNSAPHVLGPFFFPWEGNNGQNQHYFVQATGGDLITALLLSYADPTPNCNPCNFVLDMHNIDVASTVVPEPTTLALLGTGILGLGLLRRRKKD